MDYRTNPFIIHENLVLLPMFEDRPVTWGLLLSPTQGFQGDYYRVGSFYRDNIVASESGNACRALLEERV